MAVYTRTDPQGRKRYDIAFMQRGRRVLERTPPGTTLKQATEREVQLRREAYEVDTLRHAPEVLLSEVIQGWLATKPHKHHRNAVNKANQWIPFIKGRRVSEALAVAQKAVAAWQTGHASGTNGQTPRRALSVATINSRPDSQKPSGRGRRSESLSIATVNRRLAILKAALTWHGREDLSRKIKLRRENNARENYLTRAQILALAKAAPDTTTRATIMLLAFSGLRPSELLNASEADLQRDTLRVPSSKNGKPRNVPLPSHVRRYASALPLGMSYDQLYKGFSAARKAAGFGPDVIPYTLRHSYASMLINNGVGIKTVAELMGNSVEVCAKHYAHLYDKTLKDAVRKLR